VRGRREGPGFALGAGRAPCFNAVCSCPPLTKAPRPRPPRCPGANKGKEDAASDALELLQAIAPPLAASLAAAGPGGAAAAAAAAARSGAGGAALLLQPAPPESALQAAAAEVQALLIAGRRADALRAAMDGQLWPVALLLAQGGGEAQPGQVAAAMADALLAPTSPLHTYSLLLAGRGDLAARLGEGAGGPVGSPGGRRSSAAGGGAATYASEFTGAGGWGGPPPTGMPLPGAGAPPFPGAPGAVPPPGGPFQPAPRRASEGAAGVAGGGGGGLHDWRQHLAIVAANRTPGDVDVLLRIGDRLWAEGHQVRGAGRPGRGVAGRKQPWLAGGAPAPTPAPLAAPPTPMSKPSHCP
jgi:hypothetical protein